MKKKLIPVSFVCVISMAASVAGCFKSTTKPHNPADSTSNAEHDVLYMLSDAGLQKIEASSGKTDWTTGVNQGVGTFNCPLDYSMGNVYFGGLSDMASFNYQTGATNWENSMLYDPSVSISSDYRGTAFQDSLVFYTRPTGVYNGVALLFCAYQDNGQILWTNEIDSNSGGLSDFNSIPVVVNGNVITLTRGYYGDFRLTAYNAVTGALVWNTPINDALSAELHVSGNYVYDAVNATAFCYSSKDGSLQWQTDLQIPPQGPSSSGSFVFLDNNLLIVCRNYNETTNLVREINTTTGQMVGSMQLDVPEAFVFGGYGYKNNVLYTVNMITNKVATGIDSLDIVAFDLSTQQVKWKYTYTQSTGLRPVVTSDNILVPGGVNDAQGLHAQILFLNFNGGLVKRLPYAGTTTNRFLFLDNNGILCKEPDY